MLDPHLRAGLLQQRVDRGPRRRGLLLIVGRRDLLQRPLRRVVIQVAGQHQRSGLRELEKQRLVAGRVPGRRDQQDRPVAEHVVVAFQLDRFAALEPVVGCEQRLLPRRLAEERVPLGRLHQQRRAGVCVRIRDVIGVSMRDGEIGDVLRRVAELLQLAAQCPAGDIRAARRLHLDASGLDVVVWNDADVPQQRASWMGDQVTGVDKIGGSHLRAREAVGRRLTTLQDTAVEHVEPHRRHLRCLAGRLQGASFRACQKAESEQRKRDGRNCCGPVCHRRHPPSH